MVELWPIYSELIIYRLPNTAFAYKLAFYGSTIIHPEQDGIYE